VAATNCASPAGLNDCNPFGRISLRPFQGAASSRAVPGRRSPTRLPWAGVPKRFERSRKGSNFYQPRRGRVPAGLYRSGRRFGSLKRRAIHAVPYRSLGVIHGQRGELCRSCSAQLTVNNSGGSIIEIYTAGWPLNLRAGFAARPGRRICCPKRSTFTRRASPPDGGFCSITNSQNFSPAFEQRRISIRISRAEAKSAFPN